MASTSASSVPKRFKYDVFLSFRGEDTRKTFVDHLYHALDQKGIITYKDDEKIEKGERINDQLIRSIEESRFYIVVFSKNYASSSWCLDELVKIMECQKMTEHTAYPIFYDVEPTEVRNHRGSVGEAFAKHEKRSLISFNEGSTGKRKRMLEDVDLENEDDVGRWRNALKEAAGLAGMELKNTFNGHEAKFIQQIVQDISLKLYFVNLHVDGKLVGMEARVKNVVSSLETGCDDVRMIGIKGMGGGGKTTLARAVFNHISPWFEGKSFVENVRESSKGFGLKELQKQILSVALNDKSIDVTSVSDGKDMMKMRMCSKKVLVVLDDVDDIEQLEALAGELTWFKPGSRIIVTTRDEQVLIAQRVSFIHDVSLLSNEEAICLFSRYAFRREIPVQGFEELSQKVVHYAAGLPLTIKVLGSHLCGRTEREWVDAIERLKTIPLEKTLKRLELSYNGLENDQKEIFLDVVCILKYETIGRAIRVLESCGFNAQIGLRVLEQKSLITISDCGYLHFHDHIEEMGRNIVRRLHPDEPNRHSRLWVREEIEDILVNDLGTKATRSIKLEGRDLHPSTIINGLRKMKKLRYLYVFNGYGTWKVDKAPRYLPDPLRSLYWHGYPFCWLPKTFQANKLVNLEMSNSNISELWERKERKVLKKLKFLNLSASVYLKSFDLGLTPHLEELNLDGCNDFVDLHFPFECSKLKSINLSGTKVSYLNIGLTPHIEELNLAGCNDFVDLHLPFECSNLKFINLNGTKVSYLNIGLTPHIEELNLAGCNDFVDLHFPFEYSNLKAINLSGTKVSYLNIRLTPYLQELNLGECKCFADLHLPFECSNLKSIILCGTKVSYLNIGLTPHLEELNLAGCNDFVELHLPFECSNLKSINLSGTKVSYLNIGLTPHLEWLNLSRCYSLQEIHAPMGCLKNLHFLNLNACLRFEEFFVNSGYKYRATLRLTVESLDTCPLHPNNNWPKFQFKCEYDETLPSSSGNLEKLISFGLCACTNLESFSTSICGLQQVQKLTLRGSIPDALVKDLYQLESIERLTLSMKEIKHLPESICMLKHLKSIDLSFDCIRVEKLPKELGHLECLEELNLGKCTSLRDIPDSICNMKSLKILDLSNCIQIERLPKELGRVECLEKLNLTGCKSLRDIPKSICNMKCLKRLDLSDCILIEKLPEKIGCLECLEKLDLTGCKSLRDIPNSICNMKCLKHLDLSDCILIEKFPEELGRLECLEALLLRGCSSVRDIPNYICKMKCLNYLNLNDCILVEKLPVELGCLECLKELSIRGAGISGLPQSIYQLKGLRIIGSTEQLESYGFTSIIEKELFTSFYYYVEL